MIVSSPEEFQAGFLEKYGDGDSYRPTKPAVLRAAMLVDPTGFRVAEESLQDNRYMDAAAVIDSERAHAQHQALVEKLKELGVPVLLFPGRPGMDDGIYPNNVFATAPGRFLVGAMRHPGRRAEARREDVRGLFRETFGYEVFDLSSCAPSSGELVSAGAPSSGELVAELTGPMVLDRPRNIGYCGLSGRADEAGCAAMHAAFGLELTFRFELVPTEYHANIVLAILAGRVCVVHKPSFRDPEVVDAISKIYPGRTLLLTDEEKNAFAGNCIAVTERDALFSETSVRALRPESMRMLQDSDFRVHGVPVDELEKGGGSLRCLIAEIL